MVVLDWLFKYLLFDFDADRFCRPRIRRGTHGTQRRNYARANPNDRACHPVVAKCFRLESQARGEAGQILLVGVSFL
jgi:hypothetical protein